MKNVLVIAVHPDDETLGCGGTLLKHRHQGDLIHWCIVTSQKEELGFTQAQIVRREQEITAVAEKYGFTGVEQLRLPTTQLDQLPLETLVKRLSEILRRIQPHTLYLPFKGDVHSDHRVTFQAAFSCTKTFRYPFLKRVLMMETLSETEFSPSIPSEAFVPNVFSDISEFCEGKIEIANIYTGEFDAHPFPRSERNLRALATLRGATANCEWAEAFMLLKEVL